MRFNKRQVNDMKQRAVDAAIRQQRRRTGVARVVWLCLGLIVGAGVAYYGAYLQTEVLNQPLWYLTADDWRGAWHAVSTSAESPTAGSEQ